MVVDIALREAYTVRSFRACDDDFLDAQLASRFDDVVRAEHIAAEAFAVRDEQITSVRGEVDHGIGLLNTDAAGPARVLVVGEVEVGG